MPQSQSSPIKADDQMLFYNITMKKFVDYLNDLTMNINLRPKAVQGQEPSTFSDPPSF